MVARAAAEGLDPRPQLDVGERLGEVVVRPKVEPVDEAVERRGGGQHQDPGRVAVGDEGAADGVAMHGRQVAVEDHDIDGMVVEPRQGPGAIRRHIDHVPFVPETRRERFREGLVVFHDQ